jgi:MSHA biogenesis protein MshK
MNRCLLAAAMLLLAQTCTQAQSLQDPTRPPALAAAGADGAAANAGPQLQSVLISRQPGGRHVAVIDGETLRLGDNYKGARVARITAGSVELVRGKERQVLSLPVEEHDASEVRQVARQK